MTILYITLVSNTLYTARKLLEDVPHFLFCKTGLLIVALNAREEPSLAARAAFSRLTAWATAQLLSLAHCLPGSERSRGGKLTPCLVLPLASLLLWWVMGSSVLSALCGHTVVSGGRLFVLAGCRALPLLFCLLCWAKNTISQLSPSELFFLTSVDIIREDFCQVLFEKQECLFDHALPACWLPLWKVRNASCFSPGWKYGVI